MFRGVCHTLFWAAALALAGCAGSPKPATVAVEPVPQTNPETFPELLEQIKVAYQSGDYDRGLTVVKTALELKGAQVSTYDRLGSVYFVLGRYGEALSMWKLALPFEKDARKRKRLEDAIVVARRTLGLPEEPGAAPVKPVGDALKDQAKKKPAPQKAPRSADQGQIKELYNLGIKHYAEGEYLQATSLFMRVLELDPDNADAKKALERLRLGS